MKAGSKWIRLVCDVTTVFSLAMFGFVDSLMLERGVYEYGSGLSVLVRLAGSVLSFIGIASLHQTRRLIREGKEKE